MNRTKPALVPETVPRHPQQETSRLIGRPDRPLLKIIASSYHLPKLLFHARHTYYHLYPVISRYYLFPIFKPHSRRSWIPSSIQLPRPVGPHSQRWTYLSSDRGGRTFFHLSDNGICTWQGYAPCSGVCFRERPVNTGKRP
jgi:hypothetical protein